MEGTRGGVLGAVSGQGFSRGGAPRKGLGGLREERDRERERRWREREIDREEGERERERRVRQTAPPTERVVFQQ